MTYIECDTQKIRNCGEEIVILANELNHIINKIFIRVNSLNKHLNNSDISLCIENILKEKNDYDYLINILEKFGTNYQLSATIIEDNIRKSKENEQDSN